MKKLITIVITLIFIFDATGYCLPHTFVANGLRPPLLFQKQGSVRDASQKLDHNVDLVLNKFFKGKALEILDFLGIKPDQYSSIKSVNRYQALTMDSREVFGYTLSMEAEGKNTKLKFFTKQWKQDDKCISEGRLVERLAAYGITPKAKLLEVKNKPMIIQHAAEGEGLRIIAPGIINGNDNILIIHAIAYTLGKLHGLRVIHGDLGIFFNNPFINLGHIFLQKKSEESYSAQFIDFSSALEISDPNDKGFKAEKANVRKELLKEFFKRYGVLKKIKARLVFDSSYEKGKRTVLEIQLIRSRILPGSRTDI